MKNRTILYVLALAHTINDSLQSIIAATYPILKDELALTFSQIGLITLFYQLSASVLQPILGYFFDRRPSSSSLLLGFMITAIGIGLLSSVTSYSAILASVVLFGVGSAIFHPEASRIAKMASNGRDGFAQSVFQVGGNLGGAIGPLIVAFVLSFRGRGDLIFCIVLSFIALLLVTKIKTWLNTTSSRLNNRKKIEIKKNPFSKRKTMWIMGVLLVLMFSKFVYIESLRSYFTFYLINKFELSIQASQVILFIFLFSTALGTFFGGRLGDYYGYKRIIWLSILGAAPFALFLPHSDFILSIIFCFCTGFILSSAFPTIVVYAQSLMPERVGLVSGMFFGFAFGFAGISSAVLGFLIDQYSLDTVFLGCSFMPLLGIVAFLLPETSKK